MDYKKSFSKLGRVFLDLVFPIECLVCSKEGTYLCEDCASKLAKLDKQQCLVCQTPSPFGKTHPGCVSRNKVDGAISALTHKDRKVLHVIKVFKYSFVSSLAAPLANLIVQTTKDQGLDNYFQEFIIVPVPLHQRRQNWRGFNQASLLANALAKQLNIKINENLVRRKKYTQNQVTLNADERKKNMENAFELNPDVSVGNKKILLVDDVITSGSTAHELAKLFKSNKATEIWMVSIAHG